MVAWALMALPWVADAKESREPSPLPQPAPVLGSGQC